MPHEVAPNTLHMLARQRRQHRLLHQITAADPFHHLTIGVESNHMARIEYGLHAFQRPLNKLLDDDALTKMFAHVFNSAFEIIVGADANRPWLAVPNAVLM